MTAIVGTIQKDTCSRHCQLAVLRSLGQDSAHAVCGGENGHNNPGFRGDNIVLIAQGIYGLEGFLLLARVRRGIILSHLKVGSGVLVFYLVFRHGAGAVCLAGTEVIRKEKRN